MFRKYRNKKLIEEKYKNSMDMRCVVPSVKKFAIEQEFILNQVLDKKRLDIIMGDINPFSDIIDIVRDATLKALVATGKVEEK